MQKKMGEAGAGNLSDAVGDLADAVAGKGKNTVGNSAKALAKKVSNAAKRKRVRDLLLTELEDLNEAKGQCQCDQNGGPKAKKPEKSNSPSSNWGRGISGNIEGEKTKLNSKRNELQLTGQPGEGDSDVETTNTPEARQTAGRAYKERYNKAKKESEAVLDAEPLPLNHRAMIKKYFELIRPAGAGETTEAVKPAAPPAPAAPEKK
jgi:hypothetical protein